MKKPTVKGGGGDQLIARLRGRSVARDFSAVHQNAVHQNIEVAIGDVLGFRDVLGFCDVLVLVSRTPTGNVFFTNAIDGRENPRSELR